MTQKRSNARGRSTQIRLFRCAGALLVGVAALGGCEGLSGPSLPSVANIFDKPDEKLPGKRVSVLKSGETASLSSQEVSAPIVLPAPFANANWSQPGGAATNAPGHLSVGGQLKTIWTANAGEGSSKRGRLTAIPIVYGNKIFTLDAEGTVHAISAADGGTIWSISLLPPDLKVQRSAFKIELWAAGKERAGFGGGLAADGDKIFAATGFGTVVALDPASGKAIWTKKLDIPIRQAPTAADGRVFVVNSESELFCLSATDGSELWTQKGLPANAALLNGANPAVLGNLVIVPFPSGEVTALDVKTGAPKWTETLQSTRASTSSSAIGEAARPVVDRDAVFAMNGSGQLVASSREKGERLWAREIGGSQTPWIAGDILFVVDSAGKLIALNRKDGKVRWITALPGDGRWSGPVLAGGKLWLASSKGMFIGVDGVSGTVASQTDLGSPVMLTPVVADNKLYVLTDKAKLIAMN